MPEKRTIKIKVFPNSAEDKIEERDNLLNICIRERAEKNKADLKIIKLLSKYLGVSHTKIKLRGLTTKNKTATIKNENKV